jgi:PP-loop superfamily ATP-utilizing enzyme
MGTEGRASDVTRTTAANQVTGSHVVCVCVCVAWDLASDVTRNRTANNLQETDVSHTVPELSDTQHTHTHIVMHACTSVCECMHARIRKLSHTHSLTLSLSLSTHTHGVTKRDRNGIKSTRKRIVPEVELINVS